MVVEIEGGEQFEVKVEVDFDICVIHFCDKLHSLLVIFKLDSVPQEVVVQSWSNDYIYFFELRVKLRNQVLIFIVDIGSEEGDEPQLRSFTFSRHMADDRPEFIDLIMLQEKM